MVGSLAVPVGQVAFRSRSVTPSLSFAGDFPVNQKTGVLVNVGANLPDSDTGRVVQDFLTLGSSRALTDSTSIYLEIAGFGPAQPGLPSTVAGDLVLTHRVNPDLQFDTALFKGFSGSGLDWGFTFGMARRF